MICISRRLLTAVLILMAGIPVWSKDKEQSEPLWSRLPLEVHGFTELRSGYRLQNDPYQKDMSIMEARLQTEVTYAPQWGEFFLKADVYADGVTEEGRFDLREGNFQASPFEFMDIKIGRQIMTWGTGDLIFINDLFPKDWQAFFIGRDTNYLKAPSDAVKVSMFSEWFDMDLVYSGQFDSDRYIEGEYISYWNGILGRSAGQDARVKTNKPDTWFKQDELSMRLYKTINSCELSLYGYWGYWKSPAGFDRTFTYAQFPPLNVYGASIQNPLGPGIVNLETGYYDSRSDRSGSDPLTANSEMRFLIGYTQEIAHELTGSVQYYVEQLLDYSAYKASLGAGTARDEYRHVLTMRLTKLLMNQNLVCSVFGYYSPSDQDIYIRPNITYKASDSTRLELGANIFAGDDPYTFFGQFENNTNAYMAVRHSF